MNKLFKSLLKEDSINFNENLILYILSYLYFKYNKWNHQKEQKIYKKLFNKSYEKYIEELKKKFNCIFKEMC